MSRTLADAGLRRTTWLSLMQPPHSESEAVIRLRADRARLDAGARHLTPIGTSNQTNLPGNRHGVNHAVHDT